MLFRTIPALGDLPGWIRSEKLILVAAGIAGGWFCSISWSRIQLPHLLRTQGVVENGDLVKPSVPEARIRIAVWRRTHPLHNRCSGS